MSVLLALVVSFELEEPVVAAAEPVEEALEPDADAESVIVLFEESVDEAADEESVDDASFEDEEESEAEDDDDDSVRLEVSSSFSRRIEDFRTLRILPP